MKQVLVITTSGTITTKQRSMVGGNLPPLKGEELLAMIPRNDVELVFETFSNIPGSHFIPVNGLKLSQRIQEALTLPDVHGVVVTHDTDTLEETAYLLDLTINSPKPVAMTLSSRPASTPGYDGLTNLANAIRVVTAPETRDLGVVVIINDEIHAASEVQEMYTHAIGAFQSPASGPLGRIERGVLWLRHRPLLRQHIPCSRLEETVDVIRITQGSDDRLLRHSIEDGVAGIVIEVFGSGRVPPWWLPAISDALTRRTVVVFTSRCAVGSLGDDYGYVGAYHDLRRSGALLASNLNGTKARIKLMVALGAARNNEELRRWFS